MTALPCPVRGCNRVRLSTDVLMCGRCWHACPRLLRDDVWKAFGSWRRHPSVQAVQALRLVQGLAVTAVENLAPVARHIPSVGMPDVC